MCVTCTRGEGHAEVELEPHGVETVEEAQASGDGGSGEGGLEGLWEWGVYRKVRSFQYQGGGGRVEEIDVERYLFAESRDGQR